MINDVIVVGGGASGLMAAIAARKAGASDVIVLEKNTTFGKKLLATGNGKCNFTNLTLDGSCYHSDDIDRTMEIIKNFDQAALLEFMGSLGIGIEYRDGWCYPRSMSAVSVQQAIVSCARRLGIGLKGGKKVLDVKKSGGTFRVEVDGYTYVSKSVVLACGGFADPKSGSTGEGLWILNHSGIRIKKPLPALVPLVIKNNPLKKASGVRIDAEVTLIVDDQEISRESGNLQITDYGISGIPVFQISSEALRALDQKKSVKVRLNFFPDYPPNAVRSLLEQSVSNASENLLPSDPGRLLLMGLLPEKLAEVISGMTSSQKFSIEDVDPVSMANFAEKYMTDLVLEVSGSRGFENAQTTSGGVYFDELDENLSLKQIPHLYVCGEEVDVDGVCGGYNLQWAFSSGYTAGRAAGSL
ncbi:MAG: aminoacetone oxidase family FAD-binding enzyme [Lachnospiraceae bacterium]|uniref:Aminoacetone oxidase family FAD-binding enzyme n=1 Tax=Candidatus Weimeria bifida TaxID=2599074 RepID=A0A6N7IZB7_9FIRM|nr:aminoacetone oxidase family FAD-binding enzyme [Candidatus Weimeria bifida]RRF95685.1 MAG: aminoacetone oxidase family FAD-binding enzyme [Lachnospiraceae bacterium]